MKHKEQILFCLKLQEENYEANRNVEIFEDNNSRNRNPVSCVGGMVYAFGTEAGVGGAGGEGDILGYLHFHLDNSSPLFCMSGQILGHMQQNRREQVFLPGKCRGAEADEPLYAGRQCALCSFSGGLLYSGMVFFGDWIFIRYCIDPVYLHYTYSPVCCPVPFGLQCKPDTGRPGSDHIGGTEDGDYN